MQPENLSYSKIEGIIDELIKKLGGSANVVRLLESMLSSFESKEEENARHSLIAIQITLFVCVEFSISLEDLIHGNTNSIPRGICFYMHKKYASLVPVRTFCKELNRKQPAYYNGVKNTQNIIDTGRPKSLLEKIQNVEKKIEQIKL